MWNLTYAFLVIWFCFATLNGNFDDAFSGAWDWFVGLEMYKQAVVICIISYFYHELAKLGEEEEAGEKL